MFSLFRYNLIIIQNKGQVPVLFLLQKLLYKQLFSWDYPLKTLKGEFACVSLALNCYELKNYIFVYMRAQAA